MRILASHLDNDDFDRSLAAIQVTVLFTECVGVEPVRLAGLPGPVLDGLSQDRDSERLNPS
jgi:hypothetical protein